MPTKPTYPLPQNLLAESVNAIARAKEYIYSRQSDIGGFCFYRAGSVDEPNLHDTYYAVAALTLLRADVPRKDALTRFVQEFPLWGRSYLYHYALTMDLLGQAQMIPPERIRTIRGQTVPVLTSSRSRRTREWLEETLMVLELHRRFGRLRGADDLAGLIESLHMDGGYGVPPNLWETYLCLSILDLLGRQSSATATRRFVDERQVPSVGFSQTEKSLTANIDVLYAGVRCCAALEIPIKYPADVLTIALTCRTADGGFARAPAALPDLELTFRGLSVMAKVVPDLLDAPEDPR